MIYDLVWLHESGCRVDVEMLNITEAHYSCEEDLEAARLTTSRLNSEQCEL